MEKFESITVVKYGTEVLKSVSSNGEIIPDYDVFREHGRIFNDFRERLLLVSSGAKAFGQSIVGGALDHIGDEDMKARFLAMAGNPNLSLLWQNSILSKQVFSGLITNKTSEKELQHIIQNLYSIPDKVMLQLNGNDLESPKEMHRDNDVNAANVAIWSSRIAHKVRLVFCTVADCFYEDYNSETKTGNPMPFLTVEEANDHYLKKHCGNESDSSTGGMASKVRNAVRAVLDGNNVEAWIVGGKNPENLAKIFRGEHAGTKIMK